LRHFIKRGHSAAGAALPGPAPSTANSDGSSAGGSLPKSYGVSTNPGGVRAGKYRVAREVGTDKFAARPPVTMLPGQADKRAMDTLNDKVVLSLRGRHECPTRSRDCLPHSGPWACDTWGKPGPDAHVTMVFEISRPGLHAPVLPGQVRAIVAAHNVKSEVEVVTRPERPHCAKGCFGCIGGAIMVVVSTRVGWGAVGRPKGRPRCAGQAQLELEASPSSLHADVPLGSAQYL
jgi:hypothetical protein